MRQARGSINKKGKTKKKNNNMKFKTLDSLDLTPRAVTSTACENLSKARHSQKCEAQNILRRKTEA